MTTLPGRDHDKPSQAALVAALGAAVGRDAARVFVDLASKKLKHTRPPDTMDLIQVMEVLMEWGDLMRVIARTEKVRAVTYRALHEAVDRP
jgi:hypothetical protein